MNCVCDQPVFICTDRNGDGGWDQIYLALLRGAITSSGCYGKEESGALLQSSVTVMACILVWELLISESRYYALYLSVLVAISTVL